MAEGIVASVAGKLGQLLVEETIFLRGVRDEITWLQTEVEWMQSFMKDAATKRRKGDERVKTWVKEVIDVAHQAEDIVDTFMVQSESRHACIPSELIVLHKIVEFIQRYACIPCDLLGLHKIGMNTWQIKSKIRHIRESRETYGLVSLGESSGSVDESRQPWRQFSPHLGDDRVIVGFDTHENWIRESLMDTNVRRRSVIAIVGEGGLGKTTLAARVYNCNEVKSYFSTYAWITVSQNYRVTDLLKCVIEKVSGLKMEQVEEDELRSECYKCLQEKRYLIVLDDIWEGGAWEQIRDAFPNSYNGSRLLITTRFMKVAKSADPRLQPYELPSLGDEESWELFLKVVFLSDQGVTPSCPIELEDFGRKLVKRCKGLPLALVVLGGLLSIEDRTPRAWQEVADSNEWESTSQILALSYNHLPHHHLKSCFLYLGCFPEDYEINANKLMRLWIGEGFIPQKNNRVPEETAKSYLDELVQRCMIRVVSRTKATKRVKKFQIHDLFREFCISEATEDGFFTICNDTDNLDHNIVASRRLILYGKFSNDVFRYSPKRVRTVLGFNLEVEDFQMFLDTLIQQFKSLRVMDLKLDRDESLTSGLSEEISSLIHLRYIAITYPIRFEKIPSSMGKVRNLQTLHLWLDGEQPLPKSTFEIETLRHIKLSRFLMPSYDFGRLRSLQSLRRVNAGSWIQTDLAKLSNLRKLGIYNVTKEMVTALSDSLAKLNNLKSLWLGTEEDQQVRASSLFTSNTSHQHLYKLTLDGGWTAIRGLPLSLIKLELRSCIVDGDAIVAIERCPRLAFLKLYDCRFAREEGEMVCSADGFPQLQELEVTQMSGLKHWRIERGAMPNLTYLKIHGCFDLMKMPDGIEHVASLQELHVLGSFLITPMDGDAIVAIERCPRLAFLMLLFCRFVGEEGEMVCSADGFPQLKKLEVYQMEGLKHWRIERGAMPNLTYLKIYGCRYLTKMPDGIEHVASLQELCIDTHMESFITPEDQHKVRHVRLVTINDKPLDEWLKNVKIEQGESSSHGE